MGGDGAKRNTCMCGIKDIGLYDSGGPGFTVVARGHGNHDVTALHERQSGVSAASSQNTSSGVMTLLARKD